MRRTPFHHPVTPSRFAIVSSPRSGNMWLRRLLVALFGLEERSAHTPDELDWSALPDRCVVQLHWPRLRSFSRLLDEHGFRVCVLARHPLDQLISILHFAEFEPQTARWLDGAGGDETSLIGADPCSPAFVSYATGARARALVDVSRHWWTRRALARFRYEDLVARPHELLGALVARAGIEPVAPIQAALAAAAFPILRQEATNEHFWQGTPGLWRQLLPPEIARVVSAPYVRHARRFGYDLTPDPDLTAEAAHAAWQHSARTAPVTTAV